MRRFWQDNSLSIVLFVIFFFSIVGMGVAGHHVYNEEQEQHGLPTVGFVQYLATGHFVSAVFENSESEFLQMGAYVLFTIFLRQRGSPESKPVDESDPAGEEGGDKTEPGGAALPEWTRHSRLGRAIYTNSLSIVLLLLFVVSFVLHFLGSVSWHNHEQLIHGAEAVGLTEYLGSSELWFESFQNWQSEFLSLGLLIILSVFLRQKGSPESRPIPEEGAENKTP